MARAPTRYRAFVLQLCDLVSGVSTDEAVEHLSELASSGFEWDELRDLIGGALMEQAIISGQIPIPSPRAIQTALNEHHEHARRSRRALEDLWVLFVSAENQWKKYMSQLRAIERRAAYWIEILDPALAGIHSAVAQVYGRRRPPRKKLDLMIRRLHAHLVDGDHARALNCHQACLKLEKILSKLGLRDVSKDKPVVFTRAAIYNRLGIPPGGRRGRRPKARPRALPPSESR